MSGPTRGLLALTVVLTACLPLAAASEEDKPLDTTWRVLLQQQIKTAKSCDLLEVLIYNELDLGDHVALEGRVSCIDGREFNFTRARPHQKFEFQLCEPTVC